MGTLKVEADDEVVEAFKRKAREKYGEKRGSIKKATVELMKKWVEAEQSGSGWDELEGVMEETDKTSVELQEEAWKGVD
jgi:hypothetical protein